MRNGKDPIDLFSGYAPEEKANFLLRMAHELTILARDTYEVGTEGITHPGRFRTINEIQHRLTSFLIALRGNDARRYPDDILIRLLLEHDEDAELQRQLRRAFDRTASQVTVCR